jgi:hypothetical protein
VNTAAAIVVQVHVAKAAWVALENHLGLIPRDHQVVRAARPPRIDSSRQSACLLNRLMLHGRAAGEKRTVASGRKAACRAAEPRTRIEQLGMARAGFIGP